MNKININSDITINWKIWRGVNKVEEDFVGSNLRVFLIGTENTYYLVPKAEGGVLTMTIAQGTLAAGSYDLKAIWEKNGGRTLMSSTRSSIFGITATEAPQRTEVINIVSYVESYGRDGLSAFEIAVLRGLNRGCTSEEEWIKSLYAGGGSGGGICTLGSDITIGGTELGDALLNGDNDLKSEGYLVDNTLSGDTPLNLLFKALLYRATEILIPENVVASDGSVTITKDANLVVSTKYEGTRPNGYVLINVEYTPSETAATPPEITGLEYGYKEKDGTIKLDEQSVQGDTPSITERTEPNIIVKVDGSIIEKIDGKYKFTPTPNNSSDTTYNVSVKVDEGKVTYSTNELFVWALDSAERVYDDGVKVPAKNGAEVELMTLEDTASYKHNKVGTPNPAITNASASYSTPSVAKKSLTQNLKVGDTAELTLNVTDSVLSKTAPKITGMTWGYKKGNELSSNNAIEGNITDEENAAKLLEVYYNDKKAAFDGSKYTFEVVEGVKAITAKYTKPTSLCRAEAITVTPLNEDGYETVAKTAGGMNETVGGGEPIEFTIDTIDAVLPVYVFYGGESAEIEYDGSPRNDKLDDGSAKYFTINVEYGASEEDAVDILLPTSYTPIAIKSYMFDTIEGYKAVNPVWVLQNENETYNKQLYNRYRCTDYDSMPAAQYFITIIKN